MNKMTIIIGGPASGKSTLVKNFESTGYVRFNRDDVGGSLDSLNATIEVKLQAGFDEDIILDNTYGKVEQRQAVIQLAKKYGYEARCVWLQTSIEDAQFNSSWRILSEFPKVLPNVILGPNGSKDFKSIDNIPAIALFTYKKSFEKPSVDEGFGVITTIDFKRKLPDHYTNKAVILDYDGTLREMSGKFKYPINPNEVKLLPNRSKVLKNWQKKGYLLLGVSNQSGIEKGNLTDAQARVCFDRTNELLGLDIDYQYCPHHSFPIRCYCRKPLFGLGVHFVRKYKLNPSQCVVVGDSTSDRTFATRGGMKFEWAKDFFGS